ncbi:MAG: hypothetical protein EBZ78_07560 [Verrucomicrobia bacterium]|nr:hypothetical protein [Verrucomicrobiota bacterium]
MPVFPAVLKPPKDQGQKGAEDGKGTGNHPLPLFAGDLRDKINDLLERPLRLVPGDQGGDGDGCAQHGDQDAEVGLPVGDYVLDDFHA